MEPKKKRKKSCVLVKLSKPDGDVWMDYAFCEKNVPEAVIEGTKQRAPCVFPFNYEGKQITHCTDEGVMMNRYLWCATKKNKEGGYEQWGKCIPDAKLASNEAVIRPCALPFKWNGVVYTDCKLNLLHNWCPLIPKGAIAYPLNARNDMSKDEWGKCVKPYEWLRQRGSAVGQRLAKGTAIRNRKLRAAKKKRAVAQREDREALRFGHRPNAAHRGPNFGRQATHRGI